MFNLKKQSQITSYEKYLRRDNVGPEGWTDEIHEKRLPHRDGYEQTVTEDQMEIEHKTAENTDEQVIEKVLNEAQSYVVHRSDTKWDTPPMSAIVEQARNERMKDWETKQTPHWSQTFNEKKQQGSLPSWKKNVGQHDKMVLNNDPNRFKGLEGLPTNVEQSKNDAIRDKNIDIKPLIGNVTTAHVDKLARSVKTGQTIDFDTAMVAILREAEQEKRELTSVEQKTISDLKIARTKSILQK